MVLTSSVADFLAECSTKLYYFIEENVKMRPYILKIKTLGLNKI